MNGHHNYFVIIFRIVIIRISKQCNILYKSVQCSYSIPILIYISSSPRGVMLLPSPQIHDTIKQFLNVFVSTQSFSAFCLNTPRNSPVEVDIPRPVQMRFFVFSRTVKLFDHGWTWMRPSVPLLNAWFWNGIFDDLPHSFIHTLRQWSAFFNGCLTNSLAGTLIIVSVLLHWD